MVRLAVTATKGVTDVVQATHGAIGARRRGSSAPPYTRAFAGSRRLVGGALEVGLRWRRPCSASLPRDQSELFLAALNGVLGDHLAATGNPLAIAERLQRADEAPATGKILVLVHGSLDECAVLAERPCRRGSRAFISTTNSGLTSR